MITHVAISDRNGFVWSLPKPNRHHDVIHFIHQNSSNRKEAMHLLGSHVQGFLKNDKEFLDRKEAWHEAFRCGQILPPYNPINPKERKGKVNDRPGELFSEDLW